MSAPVRSQQQHDVDVIKPFGGLDRDGVERIRQSLRDASGPVIVDLDDCVLVDPGSFNDIDLGDDALPVEVCFVSQRLSCRRLLTRVGISARFAVFQCLEDAIQARVLAAAGYGRGWDAH